MMLPNMMEVIDTYCNRTWNFANPVTEYFDATNTGIFFVSRPLISATPADAGYPLAGGVISVTGGTTPWNLNAVYNYKTYIKLTTGTQFTDGYGFQSVKIVYNSDAAKNVPKSIKQAMIEWMARKIQTASDSGKEVRQVQTGSVSVQYVDSKVGTIPDFVKMALDSYRLPSVDRF